MNAQKTQAYLAKFGLELIRGGDAARPWLLCGLPFPGEWEEYSCLAEVWQSIELCEQEAMMDFRLAQRITSALPSMSPEAIKELKIWIHEKGNGPSWVSHYREDVDAYPPLPRMWRAWLAAHVAPNLLSEPFLVSLLAPMFETRGVAPRYASDSSKSEQACRVHEFRNCSSSALRRPAYSSRLATADGRTPPHA